MFIFIGCILVAIAGYLPAKSELIEEAVKEVIEKVDIHIL